MSRPSPTAESLRRLAIAVTASLLIAALGFRPRALTFDQRLARAALSAAAGQPAAALALLDEAIAFDPALASLHLPAARLAWQAGNMVGMEAHLEATPKDLQLDPEFVCLRQLLPADPGGPPSTAAGCATGPVDTGAPLTSRIPRASELPGLAAALRIQLDADPGDLRAWEELAALTELTDPGSVEQVVLEAYRSHPQGSNLLDGLLRNALEEDPKPSLAVRAARTGQALASLGDWALAGAAWQRALELEPEFPQASAYLGLAVSRTGGDGLPWLLRASAEDPDDPLVRSLLGQHWLGGGEPVLAVRELGYAHRLDPRNPAITAALGSALAQSGRITEAAEAYTGAAAENPQDPTFWLLLAEFALRYDFQVSTLGLEAARNAASLAPQDPAAASALGLANALSGDPVAGERLLGEAIALDPENEVAWYRYALVLLDQGRVEEARRALATAVELDPDGPVAGLAEASLQNLTVGFP